MESGAGAIVMETGPLVTTTGLPESVALMVIGEVPATLGVPLTRQPEIASAPTGSEPEVRTQV